MASGRSIRLSLGGNERIEHMREVKPAAWRGDGGPEVTQLGDACRHVVDPEIVDRRAVAELLPCDRRGYACARLWARRIHGGERAAPRVLVVIDEHTSRGTLGDPVFGGHQLGTALGERE